MDRTINPKPLKTPENPKPLKPLDPEPQTYGGVLGVQGLGGGTVNTKILHDPKYLTPFQLLTWPIEELLPFWVSIKSLNIFSPGYWGITAL